MYLIRRDKQCHFKSLDCNLEEKYGTNYSLLFTVKNKQRYYEIVPATLSLVEKAESAEEK